METETQYKLSRSRVEGISENKREVSECESEHAGGEQSHTRVTLGWKEFKRAWHNFRVQKR